MKRFFFYMNKKCARPVCDTLLCVVYNENKTMTQVLSLWLLSYLFVTPTGFKPVTF